MSVRASAAFALAAVVASGCVSRGTYREVAAERDRLETERAQLEERARLLEASNASLATERVRLLNEFEDLREEKGALESDVAGLRRERQELESSLQEREAALSEFTRTHETYEALVKDLEAEVATGQIQIEQLREGLRLNLSDEILFPSGSAELTASGHQVLARVAAQLRGMPHRVEVQGHTDDVPIRGALAERYASNWELAGTRAARVVRLLEQSGVDPARLTAVSFGEHHPVAPNDSPEHRARNRRIEIRLIPTSAAAPAAEAPAPPP